MTDCTGSANTQIVMITRNYRGDLAGFEAEILDVSWNDENRYEIDSYALRQTGGGRAIESCNFRNA